MYRGCLKRFRHNKEIRTYILINFYFITLSSPYKSIQYFQGGLNLYKLGRHSIAFFSTKKLFTKEIKISLGVLLVG